jgi:hypothetical protein
MKGNNKPFAEIIESSLIGWSAQSWDWQIAPEFGSLLTIDSKQRILYGIVHDVRTGTLDSSRYPFAYQKTEDELLREQPQIFEFLKTTFSCITVGYEQEGQIIYQLAPEPAKIHSFVTRANQALQEKFFKQESYLHLIFGAAALSTHIDELILAILKTITDAQLLTTERLEKFFETFSLLSGGDYRRLKLFLQRASFLV